MDDWAFVARTAEPLVVPVTGLSRESREPNIGTAFHIGNGWLLTAAHVWDDLVAPQVWIWHETDDFEGQPLEVDRLARPCTSDLLLLHTNFPDVWARSNGTSNPTPRIAPVEPSDMFGRAELGMPVVVVGFPRVASARQTRASMQQARVSRAPFQNSTGRWFPIDGVPRPGLSGGPVLNGIGRFLGVVSRDNRDDESAKGFLTCGDVAALEEFLRRCIQEDEPLDLGPGWGWLETP